MNLAFDTTLAAPYHSQSQRIRVLTESWVAENLYCPRCGAPHITHLSNKRPVADFECPACGDIFELKSSGGGYHRKVVDGEYGTMIRRIHEMDTDFLFLFFDREALRVSDLMLVPKHYFVDGVIEKRKPLAATARRAGWTGCQILLGNIPSYGRLEIIHHGVVTPKDCILAKYRQTDFMAGLSASSRGWLFDILSCLEKMPVAFTLTDMYAFEEKLTLLHPDNHNIRPKIRQQLQFLRNEGLIEFLGKGQYRKK